LRVSISCYIAICYRNKKSENKTNKMSIDKSDSGIGSDEHMAKMLGNTKSKSSEDKLKELLK